MKTAHHSFKRLFSAESRESGERSGGKGEEQRRKEKNFAPFIFGADLDLEEAVLAARNDEDAGGME